MAHRPIRGLLPAHEQLASLCDPDGAWLDPPDNLFRARSRLEGPRSCRDCLLLAFATSAAPSDYRNGDERFLMAEANHLLDAGRH